ncbi:Protein of unknown function [Pyronema omphalodes CBS 100304]|uniref:Uncharacterized protein n=1 Tax=Pyronema omphalodes (strain CBS 100304) TaxID=1076935 RepID=U4KW24_PYROM|nr:Protein of unknown function [Pyronema omphalodes CBS 100304]
MPLGNFTTGWFLCFWCGKERSSASGSSSSVTFSTLLLRLCLRQKPRTTLRIFNSLDAGDLDSSFFFGFFIDTIDLPSFEPWTPPSSSSWC